MFAPLPDWLEEFNEESRRKEAIAQQLAELNAEEDTTPPPAPKPRAKSKIFEPISTEPD